MGKKAQRRSKSPSKGSSSSSSGSDSSSSSSSSSSDSASSSSSSSGSESFSPPTSPPPREVRRNGSHHEQIHRSHQRRRESREPPPKRSRRSPSLDNRRSRRSPSRNGRRSQHSPVLDSRNEHRYVARDRHTGRTESVRRDRDRYDGHRTLYRHASTHASPADHAPRSRRSFSRERRPSHHSRDARRGHSPQRNRQETRAERMRQERDRIGRQQSFDYTAEYLERRAQEVQKRSQSLGSGDDHQAERSRHNEGRASGFDLREAAGRNERTDTDHRSRRGWSPTRNGDQRQEKPERKRPFNSETGPPQSKEVWGTEDNRPQPPKEEKEIKPDFGLSGALADETNKVNGVTLVYQEPPEAAPTNTRWRLYTFKGGELAGEPLYLHRQSCYLFGRERRVVDVPTDHPSCSKQHAVFQYRRTSKIGEDGMPVEAVRPYLMDLGSTNGTFINNERLEAQRFYEVLEKDVMKMGHSSREYVLLHEGSLNE